MTDTEALAYRETAIQEGGWYDGSQPRDPNPTYQGVTQHRYEEAGYQGSVHDMTEEQRAGIYRAYWTDAECALFGPLSAPLVFDHAFNGGVGASKRMVQRCLGLTPDGKYGPLTRSAIAATDDRFLAHRIIAERLISYDEISDAPAMRPNLKTWVGRLTDYARKYLRPA